MALKIATKHGVIDMTAEEEAEFLAQREIDNDPAKLLQQKRESMRCTRAQAKLALKSSGLLAAVQTHINTLSTDDDAVILWNDALEFQRLNPALISIANALGMTDTQLDALFDDAVTR